jgi:3-hydroxybutyryl-CoA dehydratase
LHDLLFVKNLDAVNLFSKGAHVFKILNHDELLGLVCLYKTQEVCAFFAVYPFTDNKQLISNMLQLLLEDVFSNYQASKVSCEILDFNNNIEIILQNGFEIEAKFKKHIRVDSEYKDVIRLTCHKHNYIKHLKNYSTTHFEDDKDVLKIGQVYSKNHTFDAASVQAFAALSGDLNPIHIDEKYAQTIGFEKNIVHGIFSASLFSKIIGMEFPGSGSIYISQNLEFLKPIFVNQEVLIQLKIISIVGSKYTLSTKIYAAEQLLVDGIATILKK